MSASRYLAMISCGLAVCPAMAESVYPINPQEYGMQKAFGPPAPINPKTVLTATPENQFDTTNRDLYPNAVNRINDRMDKKAHVTVGQYGDNTYAGALWRQREADYYIIGDVNYTKANDYKDGDDNTVDFGYDRKGSALVLGFLPTYKTEHRLTLVYDDIDNDKQPQHLLDAVNTRRMIGKYNGRIGAQDNSNTINVELVAVDAERNANNFDLRTSPNPKMPKVLVEVERQKYLADAHYNKKFNEQLKGSIGLRYKKDTQDAKRFVKMKTPKGVVNVQNGYRFPDVEVKTAGVYVSEDWTPAPQHNVKGALDYTWQTANANKANETFVAGKNPKTGKPIKLSSTGLWQAYYGKKLDDDIEQSGLSGKLRYTFSPNTRMNVYTELSSLYRMPENSERFAVLPGPGKGAKLANGKVNPVGKGIAMNPWINPERENRLTLGATVSGDGWGGYQITKQDDYASAWQISGNVFYADVDDFITFDRYRGKKPPLQNNIISKNVDATLAGINLDYKHNITQNLSASLDASYNYGQNKTDDRPLYQVTPFTAGVGIDWHGYFNDGSYSVGSHVRHQSKQSRRDDNILKGLGMDNATDGFTTLDIYGGVEWKNNVGLSFGVDNVLDTEYSEYLTGGHVEALKPNSVNAPGRTFWARVTTAF